MEEVLTLTMVVTNLLQQMTYMWKKKCDICLLDMSLEPCLCPTIYAQWNKKKFIEKKLVDIVRSVLTYTSTKNTVLWSQYLITNAKVAIITYFWYWFLVANATSDVVNMKLQTCYQNYQKKDVDMVTFFPLCINMVVFAGHENLYLHNFYKK